MKLKTILVEDELLWQKMLLSHLQNHCSETIEVVDVTTTVDQSIKSIREHKPQLVFFDIQLGDDEDDAFNILNALEQHDFKIVFTTVFETPSKILQALNAHHALKYLVKPIKVDELIDAVNCVIEELKAKPDQLDMVSIKKLLLEYTQKNKQLRLQIPQPNGFQYVPYEKIIMLRSSGNSTILFSVDTSAMTSRRNLSYFESVLPSGNFFRVSKSFLINVDHIDRYSTEDGGTIYLSNDCSAPLSRLYKEGFMKLMQGEK
jgi:two-component system LytT family response regulator